MSGLGAMGHLFLSEADSTAQYLLHVRKDDWLHFLPVMTKRI